MLDRHQDKVDDHRNLGNLSLSPAVLTRGAMDLKLATGIKELTKKNFSSLWDMEWLGKIF